ncbi:MAG: futalosine hydrolase [Chitinophagaceae bacterium]
MKKILITAATDFELSGLQSVSNKFKQYEIELLATGVGMLSTAFHLTKHILANKPDVVFQMGIAGCFNKEMPLTSVVIIEKEFIADLGVEENNEWKDIFDLGLAEKDLNPFTSKGLENKNINLFTSSNFSKAIGITVNEITTNSNRIALLANKYKPVSESMEGGALHFVCNSLQVPYLQIRGMSNYVGERDKSKWEINKAITNTHQTIQQLINDL